MQYGFWDFVELEQDIKQACEEGDFELYERLVDDLIYYHIPFHPPEESRRALRLHEAACRYVGLLEWFAMLGKFITLR